MKNSRIPSHDLQSVLSMAHPDVSTCIVRSDTSGVRIVGGQCGDPGKGSDRCNVREGDEAGKKLGGESTIVVTYLPSSVGSLCVPGVSLWMRGYSFPSSPWLVSGIVLQGGSFRPSLGPFSLYRSNFGLSCSFLRLEQKGMLTRTTIVLFCSILLDK